MDNHNHHKNALGLAALHIVLTTGFSPADVMDLDDQMDRRAVEWLTIVVLMKVYGMSSEEVADLLGVTSKSVQKTLARLRVLQTRDQGLAALIDRWSDKEQSKGAA